MGVHGLWKVLKSAEENITLNELKGKKIAVDISIWMYRMVKGMGIHDSDSIPEYMMKSFIKNLSRLVLMNITPIFVFDGGVPEMKKRTIRNRRATLKKSEKVYRRTAMKILYNKMKINALNPENVGVKVCCTPRSSEELFQFPTETEVLSSASSAEFQSPIGQDQQEILLEWRKKRSELIHPATLKPGTGLEDFSVAQIHNVIRRNQLSKNISKVGTLPDSHRIESDSGSHFVLSKNTDAGWSFIPTQNLNVDEKVTNIANEPIQYCSEHPLDISEPSFGFDSDEPSFERSAIEETHNNAEGHLQNLEKKERKLSNINYAKNLKTEESTNEFLLDKKHRAADYDICQLRDTQSIPQKQKFPKIETNLEKSEINYDEGEIPPALGPQNDQDESERHDLQFLHKENLELHTRMKKVEKAILRPFSKLISEFQTILELLGVPFISSPMEAESQCAFLQLNNQVDGVISDDCDCFLFGATIVYKNFFDSKKPIACYSSDKIYNSLNLGRQNLVDMAYLLGSDYSTGIYGIGISSALEIVKTFPDGIPKRSELNQSFAEKRKKSFQNFWAEYNDELLASVKNAYFHPVVSNVDDEQLRIRPAKLKKIREFCMINYKWELDEIHHLLSPFFDRR